VQQLGEDLEGQVRGHAMTVDFVKHGPHSPPHPRSAIVDRAPSWRLACPPPLYLAWSAVLVKAGAVGLRETVLPLEAQVRG
jgi:hypothetical protein